MIPADQERFREAFTALMLTFPNAKVSPGMAKVYWQVLKPRLEIDEFEEACGRMMADDREFPPRPRDFIDAVSGDLAVDAHHWWQRLTDFSRSGPYRYIVATEGYALTIPIPDRARFALEAVGGPARLANAGERDMDFIRQRFETAFSTATSHEIERPDQPLLPRSNEVTRIGDAIVKALPKGASP